MIDQPFSLFNGIDPGGRQEQGLRAWQKRSGGKTKKKKISQLADLLCDLKVSRSLKLELSSVRSDNRYLNAALFPGSLDLLSPGAHAPH